MVVWTFLADPGPGPWRTVLLAGKTLEAVARMVAIYTAWGYDCTEPVFEEGAIYLDFMTAQHPHKDA